MPGILDWHIYRFGLVSRKAVVYLYQDQAPGQSLLDLETDLEVLSIQELESLMKVQLSHLKTKAQF